MVSGAVGIRFSIFVAIALSVGTQLRAAEPAAAVARGEDIARNVCSACHVASSGQQGQSPIAEAPPFTAIANRPETTYRSLHHFIATTHWDMKTLPPTMPNPMLTDSQVSDVSHYIMSLRTAAPGKK